MKLKNKIYIYIKYYLNFIYLFIYFKNQQKVICQIHEISPFFPTFYQYDGPLDPMEPLQRLSQ